MHHMHPGYGFGSGSIWSTVLMILFWVVLIILLVLLFRGFFKNNAPKQKETPTQILKKRLAKGEIDEAEYQRLKAVLKED